jgi:hypothetical protein
MLKLDGKGDFLMGVELYPEDSPEAIDELARKNPKDYSEVDKLKDRNHALGNNIRVLEKCNYELYLENQTLQGELRLVKLELAKVNRLVDWKDI